MVDYADGKLGGVLTVERVSELSATKAVSADRCVVKARQFFFVFVFFALFVFASAKAETRRLAITLSLVLATYTTESRVSGTR